MTTVFPGKVVRAGEGTLLLNDRWWLTLPPNETPGGLAIMEALLPRGARATRIHRHHDTDEIWYILEGQLTFRIGPPAETIVRPLTAPHQVMPTGSLHCLTDLPFGRILS